MLLELCLLVLTKILFVDSGATDHIFTEREHFVEYTPTLSTQRAFITTADGSSHKVAGTGTRQTNNVSKHQKHVRCPGTNLPGPSYKHI